MELVEYRKEPIAVKVSHEVKVVVLGHPKVGKSSIVYRFCQGMIDNLLISETMYFGYIMIYMFENDHRSNEKFRFYWHMFHISYLH